MIFRTAPVLAAVVLMALGVVVPGEAQTPTQTQTRTPTPTPTPEQLRMLQQLPESQRQELMRSMGIEALSLDDAALEFPDTVRPPGVDEEAEDGPPRLQAQDTIIVRLELPEPGAPGPGQEFERRVDLDFERRVEEAMRRNPQLEEVKGAATYVLDHVGRIHFPGIASVALAGLTEIEAARRIEAEPSLRIFEAKVT